LLLLLEQVAKLSPASAMLGAPTDDKPIGLASRDDFARVNEAVEIQPAFRSHVTALFDEWMTLYLQSAAAAAALAAAAGSTSPSSSSSGNSGSTTPVGSTSPVASDSATIQAQANQAAFINKMQQQGICKTDDLARKFFIVTAELCIDRHLAGLPSRKVPVTSDVSNAQYHIVDAFARLVALLTRNYFTEPTSKVCVSISLSRSHPNYVADC
jgi:hypothetical protein